MRLFVGPRSLFSALALGMFLVLPAGGQSKPRPSTQRQALNLFASAGAVLQGNRVICGLNYVGEICSTIGDSPISGGAFWPQGTPDAYIFHSGLQLAGIVSPAAGFAWAGDTVGAYFVDLRGTQTHSDALTLLFDSRNPDDLAQWPNGAIVRDPAIYAAGLIGRNSASEQDVWGRYWDGNPAFLSGRTHPMGVMVEQRVLAWNSPSGNEDIVYVVATLTNVTASDPAVYANATIPPAVQGEIAAVGAQFQQLNETQLGVAIPNGGYTLEQVYLGLVMDHDVAVFSTNYSTVSLPFRTAYGYSGRFQPEFGWTFPLEVFGATPFAALPGLMGTKFLRAPAGLAMYSSFTGAPTGHADPIGVNQLWRYLSGYFGSSDAPCNVSPDFAVVRARKVCFVKGFQSDDRYSQSIGPFQLAPGESQTVVLAYLFAAPLDTAMAYAGGDLPPGFPFPGDSIFQDTTKIRAIERVAGWRGQADTNGNGIIEDYEVDVAPRSLLHKARLAQAMVDHKFQMPEAPAQPSFFLIPGDHNVTVVWQPSASETTGDPYFPIAQDPTSAAYDPNYRQFDVEGYRIFRGYSPNALTLVAQFDYQGTVMVDYTGAFHYFGQCAPELGILTDCPVAFPATPDPAVFEEHDLAGWVVQVPAGARIVSGNGALAVLRTDTATVGSGWQDGYLSNQGVPFAYVDTGLTNSFPLYYSVTAFDVNSLRSGPSSFESPRLVKSVTPRIAAGQETGGAVTIEMLNAAGGVLDSTVPLPTLNPATGIFAGPMPPTNAIAVRLLSFLPQVVGTGSITLTLDSVIPGMAELDVMPGRSRPTLYHFTRQGSGAPVSFTVRLEEHQFEQTLTAAAPFEGVAVAPGQVARFGGDSTFALFGETGLTSAGTWRTTSFGRADVNGLPGNSAFNGPRWWVGTPNENEPNPNGGLCTPAQGGCGNTVPVPLLSLTAGNIPGVTIFHVQAYSTVPNAPMRNLEAMLSSVVRAADFRVFWGSAGTVDSVFDVTHGVRVPFHPAIRASWGILNQASFAATDQALTRDGNNALLTWADIFCIDPSPSTMSSLNNGNCGGTAQTPAVLQNSAALNPIAFASSSYADTDTLSATGDGFIFYLNGHFFLMQTATLPPQGTVWNARFYSGNVTGSATGANFAFQPAVRPPPVPGLRVRVTYQGSALNTLAVTDSQLARVHTVPDPLYVASAYMTTPDTAVLRFVNLPSRAIIRIYSTSGILVAVLPHDDPTDGGEAVWNLRNRNGRWVASGVYFYHIETPAGRKRVGRFTVITNAPLR